MPWWLFWTLLAVSLGGIAFTLYAAVCVGKRDDERQREELERQFRLPARDRLGLSDLEVEQQLRPRRSLLVFSGRKGKR